MATVGKFLLRSVGDTQNPYAARLYGRGLTAGRVFFYLNNAVGNRTAFLSILTEGARFRGDLAMDGIDRVWYSGFELPEFDESNARNWRFYPGTVSAAPDYKVILDISGTGFHVTGHGYTNSDRVALWARGTDATLTYGFGNLATNVATSYGVHVIDANHFELLDVDENAIAISAIAHLDRIFVYKATANFFDPVQGVPDLFPDARITFAGLSYLTVLLPANLSTGVDEPTGLKVKMRGKQMYDLHTVSSALAFDTSVITALPNNALVSADVLVNDGKRDLTRFEPTSWIAWRDRCRQGIDWLGGEAVPAPRSTWHEQLYTDFDATTNTLTRNFGGSVWDAFAATEQFTDDRAVLEARYTGSAFMLAFSATSSGFLDDKQGVVVEGGYLKYLYLGNKYEIMPVGIGDKIKIIYENSGFFVYRNGIKLPPVDNTYSQHHTTYYIVVGIYSSGGTVDSILVAPSGILSAPRQVPRFEGAIVAAQPMAVADLFESEIVLSAASWADVDGQIKIATDPDRTPCFTFNESNTAKITVRRKDPQTINNFWSFSYRDDDDDVLATKYPPAVDRPALRAVNGGRLISSGVQEYGVMKQSQVERLSNARVRVETDFDIGFTIEAFLDSQTVCKGSYVYVWSPATGYTEEAPALCQVIDERLNISDVETRIYDVQIVTPTWYSDTDHSAAIIPAASNPAARYTPPPPVTTLTLTETYEPMPDRRVISSISGLIEFGAATKQRGRVYTQALVSKLFNVTYSSSTHLFTKAAADTFPSGSTPITLASSSNSEPGDNTADVPLYVVNISGNTCKLSETIGGAAKDFTSNGADLAFYNNAAWIDTGIDVIPDAANTGGFEIIPARLGLTLVRVQTFSAADASLPFKRHTYSAVQVTGSIIPPDPPTSARYEYDGVVVKYIWTPSPTFGVSAYWISDEQNRFIAQVNANQLSWVEPAQAASVTRRIYAVSSSGVLSSTYAEVTFVPYPNTTSWANISGLTINPNNSLTKTAAAGWDNCGAILNKAVATGLKEYRVSGAPDRTNVEQAFGLSTGSSVNGLSDFSYAVHFHADGTVSAYDAEHATDTDIGTYQQGDRFIISVTPSYVHEPSSVFIQKIVFGSTDEVLAYTFDSAFPGIYPLYIGVAINTASGVSALDLQTQAILTPIIGITPADADAQNLAAATYASGTLQTTGGSGWGSSGGSFVTGLREFEDGGFTMLAGHGVAIGLSTTDTDQTADSMLFSLRIDGSGGSAIYGGATLLDTGGTIAPSDVIFIGRENGYPVISVNGEALFAYGIPGHGGPSPSDALKSGPVILDVALRHDQSATANINTLKFYPGDQLHSGYDGARPSVYADLKESAQVGLNPVANIPRFLLTNPVEGDVLVFDSEGNVFNGAPGAFDPTLAAIADLTIVPNSLIVGTGTDTFAITEFTPSTFVARASTGDLVPKTISDFAFTLLDDANQAAMRVTLDVQPYDATLTALASADWVANAIPIGTGADILSQTVFGSNTFPARASTGNLIAKPVTDFALSLLTDGTQAAMRTRLSLTPGTDIEAHNSNLTDIAALSPADDDFMQRKASHWVNRTAAQVKVDLGLAGTNSGDVSLNGAGENYLTLSSQVLFAHPVDLSNTNVTGTLAAGRFPALSGDISNTAGSLVTAIGAGRVTFAMLATGAWSDDTTLSSDSSTKIPTIHSVKTYIDTQITGLKFKLDCIAASTANVSVSSSPSSIDGVSLTSGDRVLLKNQTTASENGVYIFASAGAALSRAPDSDTGPELVSATYPVRSGTVNQDTWWTVTNDTISLGSTSIVFTQTGGGGTYTNGAGLTLTGNSFSIATGGVTNAMLAGSIAYSKLILTASLVTGDYTDASVTLAKMANMATSSLIYRKTAGSGVPEVNTLATLKTDLGLTGTNSGDQTITLTADVTGSGTGSIATTIAANAVTTGKIINSAVTLAKMADMATASLIYRRTAGTGAPEVNTLAQLKLDLNLPMFDIRDYGATVGSADNSTAINAATAAATAAGGGRVFVPQGDWRCQNIAIPAGVYFFGVGSHTSSTTGSTLKMVSGVNNSNILNITTGYRNCGVQDLNLHCDTSTGSKCLQISGTNPTGIGFLCRNVAFHNGQYGVWINATGAPSVLWETELIGIHSCIWEGQTVAGFYCNSSNGCYVVTQPYMSLPANAHGFDLPHAGAMTVTGWTILGPSTGTGVCFNVTGQHVNLLIQGGQDEGMMGFLNHGVSDYTYVTTLVGNTIQSPIVFTQSGAIKSSGNTYHFSDTFTASGSSLGVIISSGDVGVLSTTFGGSSTTAWRLKAPEDTRLVVLSEQSVQNFKTTYNAPVRFSSNVIFDAQSAVPVVEIGFTQAGYSGAGDKPLLQLGRIASTGLFDLSYGFRFINATGRMSLTGTQTASSGQNGFVAFDFNGEFTGTNFRANSARPATITARQDNWSTGATGSAAVVAQNIFVQSTADRSFTGMALDYGASYPDGYQRIHINESIYNHTYVHESGLSTAATRFSCQNPTGSTPDNIIPAGGAALLMYSNAPSSPLQRWRVFPLNTVYAGENYLSSSGNTLTANAVNLSNTNVTGTLAAARFPALSGDVSNSAGSLVTTIGAGKVTFSMFNTGAWSDDTTLAGNSSSVIPTVHAVKTYVDTQITGLKFKVDCVAASTANVSVSSAPSSIDSVTLSNGDRVLLKNQTSASENGAYIFTSAGSALSRAPDSDTGAEMVSATYPIRGGTTNQDTWWTVTNDSITIGSTSIVFTQTGGAGTYTNGSGITLTGNSFSIATGAITNAMLAGSIPYSKLSLNNSLVTGDFTNSSVTLAKMADMATASLIYRRTAGTGAPEVNTLAQLKTDLALTKSDVGLANVQNTSLIVGSNVQAWNAELDTLAALTPTTGSFIVGFSGDWASRSTSQVQTTLKMPKVLFHTSADQANTLNNSRETLYNETLAVNQLASNDDTLFFRYAGKTANNANAKHWFISFGGTTILNTTTEAGSTGITAAAADWVLEMAITRVSNTVIRYTINLRAGLAAFNFTKVDELTPPSNLSSTQALVLDVQAPAASDITAKMHTIQYIPV